MKYFLIAGEASGDLHGKNLMKQLMEVDKEATFQFWGGDQMASIGGEPLKHIDSLAFMGFVEVIANLGTILKNIKLCKSQIKAAKPDALILIDYPGFNLRIAEFAKQLNIPVHYYVSPQIWAWKQNRVHKIKKVVDEMYTILPFEKAFYKKFDYDVQYVGHPLVDAIQEFKKEALSKKDFLNQFELSGQPILALLPGSRVQEIKTKLPIMLKAAAQFKDYQIVIAGAPNKSIAFYQKYLNGLSVKIIENSTYNLLNNSSLAMVTSGTATLETALFKVPQVVCYKASYLSYHIAKRLVKVPYISLVNLIMNKEVVKELIQGDLTSKKIVKELRRLEADSADLQMEYDKLEKVLGGGGASQKVAKMIFNRLKA
ncbi:lipid-A-disaccharide synthase [Putridiphycobacter roseus]|uniref:Lipid-A-disaccharide synthase n=1 Tax=Putridiphycobacter roseus TaxID=2219161 RepID=A0A2W1NGQ0_9FLAO|nr:lipid-A-disaccharide synthase [Putridiphycobacter roseus]PZE18283.1 lipid-A-disaccharide synthase [Putridiphycobacter roseus]